MNRQPLLYLVLFFTAFSCTNTPAPEKNYEYYTDTNQTVIQLAIIKLMLNRIKK